MCSSVDGIKNVGVGAVGKDDLPTVVTDEVGGLEGVAEGHGPWDLLTSQF